MTGGSIYEGRFDEDDFEGAYRELERRYYAGEGAAFAEAGALGTEWVIALNQGDFDRVVRRAHRSRTCASRIGRFGLRRSLRRRASRHVEELNAMVASVRSWCSAVCWLSPECGRRAL